MIIMNKQLMNTTTKVLLCWEFFLKLITIKINNQMCVEKLKGGKFICASTMIFIFSKKKKLPFLQFYKIKRKIIFFV